MYLIPLVKIGFLEFGWSDAIDIILLAFLIYQLYRIVRGSLAYNIFFGILVVYILTLLAEALELRLISGVLGQFINIGVLGLLIVFQPEVRRFLLQLGKNRDIRKPAFWGRFNIKHYGITQAQHREVDELILALQHMSDSKTGALLVFPTTSRLQFFVNSGILIQGEISGDLLEAIFNKNSPLHDGAVIIADNKVLAARCVLPVSDSQDVPGHLGLRHRSAIGITEVSDALAIVVSEENGTISIASEGRLQLNVAYDEVRKALTNSLLSA